MGSLNSSNARVEGVVNYLLDTGKRPVTYATANPEGAEPYQREVDPTRVLIQDARLLSHAPRLDVEGFEKVVQPTELDLQDEAQIIERYYTETENLLKAATGAVKVVVFDHTVRIDEPGREVRGLREPVRYVHNDQTPRSAQRRVFDHLPKQEAEYRSHRRFAIINVWRPIGAPVYSTPLALCDARTLADADLVASDLVYPDKVGETWSIKANPAHRWYYYPQLRPDEALLLKIYDSQPGVAQLTAHTAFDDPNSPPGAPPRRSIELRTLVFY
ncbi:CmcJ/NvfI family oxidoreductase [Pseudomonas typographi]|uniref:Methyltransferase n=1 Tax=Pseudomonas typographi TaxID=2715964 RepID=A0ABR7YWW4_9PSED|nr:CmcJ/NvfI family oxidoreductase [Pseudomonas typographi]MBD1552640.1 methyltransferase [Pseudomonas typographi]MBD1586221.1 methyltransferase [Pseudomonas typographi]MBD1597692.1 methyltransferase [Pseudomonas typographi]